MNNFFTYGNDGRSVTEFFTKEVILISLSEQKQEMNLSEQKHSVLTEQILSYTTVRRSLYRNGDLIFRISFLED